MTEGTRLEARNERPGWPRAGWRPRLLGMRVRSTPLLTLGLLAGTLLPSLATGQVSLRDIPALARQRAERLRPLQIAALEPFWADFALEYRSNQQFLDERIQKAAELGDSVVPLLLEKLQPAQGGSTSRNLASNCRRVLQRLDPSSFVDALAEMARGKHEIARSEAIVLLGFANVPQSGRVLTDLVDQATPSDRRMIIRSLRLLKAPAAAPKVAALLGASDRKLREDVLDYLIAARADSVADIVVQAITTETDDRLLPTYIAYFGACVRNHEGATKALLPLLNRERIDWQDTRNLVKALATVAPRGHDQTARKLHELIDGNESSSLAVVAAVSLRAIGDKRGITRLKKALDDKIRRRKRDAALYEQRANLLFSIEDWSDAVHDYEKILAYTEGAAMTRRAYTGLLMAEARRRKIQSMVKHMKASGMSPEDIESLAEQDEVFRTSLEHDRCRSFLKQLRKDRAPK